MALPYIDMLPEKMTSLPKGWQTGFITNQDGARLRYGHAPTTGSPKAGLVLVTGFNEVIEKYAETINDYSSAGYVVYALDWRGQGGSDRWRPDLPQRPLPVNYADDVRDLHDFYQQIICLDSCLKDKKIFLCAHSMGGHIGLRYVHDHPDSFAGMTTTAPMLGLETRPFPRPVAETIARTMTRLGQGHRYIPGGTDWQDDVLHLAMKRLHSHDPLRRQLHHMLYRAHPEWQMGDATFRWLNTAFDSLALIQKPGYVATIETPVLIAIAGEDHLIDPVWQRTLAGAMPQGKTVDYPTSRHEIWHETDDIRSKWRDQTLCFMDGILAPALKPEARIPAPDMRIR